MIKAVLVLGLLSFAVGCGSASEDAQTFDQNLLACSTTADCPAGLTCQADSHRATNVCKSADDGARDAAGGGGASGACPSGFELEVEHGVTSCKAHGGDAGQKGENEVGDDDKEHHGGAGASGDDDGHHGEAGASADDQGHRGEGGESGDNRGKDQANDADAGDTSDPNRGSGDASGGSGHDNEKH